MSLGGALDLTFASRIRRQIGSECQIRSTGGPGAMMRTKLRKTIGLIQAALIGTLAAAALVGIALLISHS